jgi:PAS domain S-box-containing protein
MADLDQPTRIQRDYGELALWTICLSALFLTSRFNYLLFQGLAVAFSVVVACGVFMVAINASRFMDSTYFQVIGIAYLFVGGLDFIHTLAYRGMGVFEGNSTNLPTQLWIAARYMESLSLLISPLFINKRVGISQVCLCYILLSTLLLGAIFYWGLFPDCFIEGTGLTTFKVISEYVISLILLSSAGILLRKRVEFDRRILKLLIGSILTTVASELSFTLYADAYGLTNLAGHYFKVLSFYMIYKAIIETGIVKPLDLTFRSLKQSENELRMSEERFRTIFQTSPDAISINRERDGVYVDINQGFTHLAGYTRDDVIGRSTMDIDIWYNPSEGSKMVDALRRNGLVVNMEMMFRTKEDRVIAGLLSAKSITLEGVPHVLCVTRDMEKIKAATEALQEAHSKLEDRVRDRTSDLANANVALSMEISEREQIESTLRTSENELRILSSRLMLAEETERKRIARELHDSIGQTLSAIKFSLENALRQLRDAPTHLDTRGLESIVPITQPGI